MHVGGPPLSQLCLHQQHVSCTHWAAHRAVGQAQPHQVLRRPAPHVLNTATAIAASSEVVPDNTTAAASDSAVDGHDHQRQMSRNSGKQQRKVKGSKHKDTYTGRLLFKYPPPGFSAMPASLQDLRGLTAVPALSASTTSSSNKNRVTEQQWSQQQPQLHQQPQQSQPQHQDPSVSLQIQNKRFCSSLKQVVNIHQWLLLLGDGSCCGEGLNALDGVSVVAALLWLFRSRDWKQGSDSWQWHTRQGVQQAVESLLNRAEVLVRLHCDSSSRTSSSSPSHTGAASAASSPLIRPEDLASLIYLTSKLKQRRPQLLAAAAGALSQHLYACSLLELNRIIWGLAHARVHPGDTWLLNFCKSCQSKFFLSTGDHLPAMVYGLARLKYRPADVWIAAWLETAEPQLGMFGAQGLCNAAWGLAQWRFQAPDHWLESFYSATQQAMPDFEAPGISQIQLALVTLAAGNPPPREWIQQMVDTAEPLFDSMEMLQLCNFGWGLAQWGYRPPVEVMRSYMAAVGSHLVTATPTDLSTMLWICDKLSFVPDQSWLHSWFASAHASLPRCEPQHLTTMSLVLGRWGIRPKRDFMMDFWGCSKARFKDFTAYQAGLLLWGLGKVRHTVPQTWTLLLLTIFTEHLLCEAEPTDVARLIGGLGSITVITGRDKPWATSNHEVQQQLQGLCKWIEPQLGDLTPCWLVVLLMGLYKLRLPVDRDMLQSLTTAAAQLDERLKPEQRKYLSLVLQKLRRRAGSAAAATLQQQQRLYGEVES